MSARAPLNSTVKRHTNSNASALIDMNTRLLMRASAVSLGLLGTLASFLPQELLAAVGAPGLPIVAVSIQLLGGAYLGLAMLNWMAQGNLIGGIYSRPVAVCNLTHYAIAFLALIKVIAALAFSLAIAALAGYFGVFAGLFAVVVFRAPVARASRGDA
jgi:hypothetical protein